MGIVTWMSLKIQSIPEIDKIKFAALDQIDDGTAFLYRILPRRIGQECLILNNVDLAALLASDSAEFEKYKASLPPYTLILTISGLIRRPEEKIAYEEHFLNDVMRNEFQKIVLTDTLPGFPGGCGKAAEYSQKSLAGRYFLLERRAEGRISGSFLHHEAGKGIEVYRYRERNRRKEILSF